MIRISALAVCAAIALPLSAFAQDAAPATNAMTTEAAGEPMAAGDVNWDQFNEGLQGFADADVNFTADSTIEVVGVSTLTEDAEGTRDEYTVSIPSDPADIGAVKELLAGNSAVVAALEEAGFTVDDVSNIWVNQEGSVTIFVNDDDSAG